MKPTTRVHEQRLERPGEPVRARLQRLLVDAAMRVRRERAALPGLEVHDVGARSAAPERAGSVVCLGEEARVDAEARVRRLGAADRLEDEVDRRAALDRLQRRGDVREHARLRRDPVRGDDRVQHREQGGHLPEVVGGGVDADHRVAGPVEQAVEEAGGDALRVVGRVIRLQAGREPPGKPERVPEARDDPDLARRDHHVLDAHELRHGGGHLGGEARRHARERGGVGLVGEQPVAEIADGEMRDRRERRGVVPVEDEARDLIGLVGHGGCREKGGERRLGERHLRRHALLGARRRDPR